MYGVPVEGYEGRYSVTRDGRVYSHLRSKFLIPRNARGYRTVVLSNREKTIKTQGIHRLVAKAFIPNPKKKPHINHIDGDKTNNHVSNLEWVTPSENRRHALETGLAVPGREMAKPNCKLTVDDVLEIRRLHEEGDVTQRAIAKDFDVSFQLINDIVLGKRRQYIA